MLIASLTRRLGGPPQEFPPEWANAEYRFGEVRPDDAASRAAWLAAVRRDSAALDSVFRRLADDESREVMLECLHYNIAGWSSVLRSRNTPAYREAVLQLSGPESQFPRLERAALVSQGRSLHWHALLRHDMVLLTTPGFYINVLLNSQYTLSRPGVRVAVEDGDVVLDCGACFGDTSLLFAARAGAAGAVYAIEFVPENRVVLQHNLDANPTLGARVSVWEAPIGRTDGIRVSIVGSGPGTRTTDALKGGGRVFASRSIDSWCIDEHALPRVDYIKMDIEGAEFDALLGARRLIQRDAPKLAISVYHRVDDFYRIPAAILSIDPTYRFWMDHHTVHGEETVLYGLSTRREYHSP